MATRLVMWTGTPSIIDPKTIRKVGSGPKDTFAPVVNWKQENRRQIALRSTPTMGGHDRWILMSDPPGFSRDYHWGPNVGTFVQEVEDEDARLLMRLVYPPEFVDVTAQHRRVADDFVPLSPRGERFGQDEIDALRHGMATGDYVPWRSRYDREEVVPLAMTPTGRFFHPDTSEA